MVQPWSVPWTTLVHVLNFHLNQAHTVGGCEVEKEENSELLGVGIDFDFFFGQPRMKWILWYLSHLIFKIFFPVWCPPTRWDSHCWCVQWNALDCVIFEELPDNYFMKVWKPETSLEPSLFWTWSAHCSAALSTAALGILPLLWKTTCAAHLPGLKHHKHSRFPIIFSSRSGDSSWPDPWK